MNIKEIHKRVEELEKALAERCNNDDCLDYIENIKKARELFNTNAVMTPVSSCEIQDTLFSVVAQCPSCDTPIPIVPSDTQLSVEFYGNNVKMCTACYSTFSVSGHIEYKLTLHSVEIEVKAIRRKDVRT